MKNILYTLIVLSCSISLAQSPIYDIEDHAHFIQEIQNAYYKDTNNQLDAYEGTYLYSNGSITLKIVLQKKVMSYMNNYYYEDLIIGEYQYIDNGIEKINTLNRLDNDYTDQGNSHSIDGNSLYVGRLMCSECLDNEKYLRASIVEESTHSIATLQIRRTIVEGVEAIRILVVWRTRTSYEGESSLPEASFPGGYYTLIKQ